MAAIHVFSRWSTRAGACTSRWEPRSLRSEEHTSELQSLPSPPSSDLGSPQGVTVPRQIDGGDTRIQSVVYSGGRLYVTLGTQVIRSEEHTSELQSLRHL